MRFLPKANFCDSANTDTVTNAEAVSDVSWFDAHPDREFRARQGRDGQVWLIRRYGHAFLRTVTRESLPIDSDAAIRPVWLEAVYPDLLAGQAIRRAGGQIPKKARR